MTAQSDDQPTVKAEEAGSIPITKLIIYSKEATECLWFSHANNTQLGVWICVIPPPPGCVNMFDPPPPLLDV